jgi:hypothetical protein
MVGTSQFLVWFFNGKISLDHFIYEKSILLCIKKSRLVLAFENWARNRLVNNEKTIQKPDKFVRYSNGIQDLDHLALEHK